MDLTMYFEFQIKFVGKEKNFNISVVKIIFNVELIC